MEASHGGGQRQPLTSTHSKQTEDGVLGSYTPRSVNMWVSPHTAPHPHSTQDKFTSLTSFGSSQPSLLPHTKEEEGQMPSDGSKELSHS